MSVRFARNALAVILAPSMAAQASAAVQAGAGPIAALRVEGPYAFITLPATIPNCGTRVSLDMNSAVHRSMYAAAMLAVSMGQARNPAAGGRWNEGVRRVPDL